MLETFHFEKIPGGTYLLKDEEATYTFLTEGINELRQIGEVYASETFKGIKIKEPKSFICWTVCKVSGKCHFEDFRI